MAMCIHSQEFETCRFGCTLRSKEELRLENDKLQAKNERLKEEHRWIPVSERLPENIADVFILTGEGSGGIGMYGELEENVYGWERLDHAINLKITHWKPIVLPEQVAGLDRKNG